MTLGAIAVANGALEGRLDGAVAAQEILDGAPMVGRYFATGHHALDHLRDVRAGPLKQQDDGQRDFALAQVAANRLAQRRLVRHVVQHVVHDLEREAQVEAVLAERRALFGRAVAEQAADLGAAGEEVRGLAADDLEVLFLGNLRVARLRELIELAFDLPERGVAERPYDLERVLRERHRHRANIEVVAEQDRDVAAPPRVRRQTPAARFGAIDDVVVHERRRVAELDDGGVEHGAVARVAAESRREEQHGRAHALAAAHLDVLAHLRNQLDARLEMTRELALDARELVPDGLENLGEPGHGCRGWLRG